MAPVEAAPSRTLSYAPSHQLLCLLDLSFPSGAVSVQSAQPQPEDICGSMLPDLTHGHRGRRGADTQ